ncbi:MAG TPA: hypothetical protein VJ961_06005 [Mariprofundaceae bacterium]|nr:hypothetical protein [Mariprofundaceae bacterium]
MISSLLVQELLSLPKGTTEAPARLPWANGTILSGRFETASDAQNGILTLAGQRMLAKVPADMPKGDVWLQLLDRNIPAHFRFLSKAQAEAAVMRMLQKMVSHSDAGQSGQVRGGSQAHASRDTQTATPHTVRPAVLEQSDIPYRFVPVGMSPPSWLLVDEREDSPQGMLRAESQAHGFRLQGRVDLPNLGPVAFSLGDTGRDGMRLSLFSSSRNGYQALQGAFATWLHQRQENLDGSLHMGLPDEETGKGATRGYA